MSVYKLKNKTGADSNQTWANFTFPDGEAIDLIDPGEYGAGPTQYALHFNVDDIRGNLGGSRFEDIAALLRTGDWCLNDGDGDLSTTSSLHLLKYGEALVKPVIQTVESLGAMVSFQSHNFADHTEWPTPPTGDPLTGGDSEWVLAPAAGKVLWLTGSKISVTSTLTTADQDDFYFRIYVGNLLVGESLYHCLEDLFLQASRIVVNPQVGNVTTTGSREMIHAHTDYPKDGRIALLSSLGMSLKMGLSNNTVPVSTNAYFKVHVDALALDE